MATFFLTKRAILDLYEIEDYSIAKWGKEQTEIYLSDLYEAFKKLAEKPEIGKIRIERSFPFYMAPVGKHFAVYKRTNNGIIIATILHGKRNIDSLIKKLSHILSREIEELEK